MDFKRGGRSKRAQSEIITIILIIAIVIALVVIVAAVIYAFVNRGGDDVIIKGCDMSMKLSLDKNYVYANNDGKTYVKISRPVGEGCELKSIRVTFFDYQRSVFSVDVSPPKENSYQVYSFVGADNLVTRGFDNATSGDKTKKLREIQIAPIVIVNGKERVLNVKDKFSFTRDAWCAKFNGTWSLLGFVCDNPYGSNQCNHDSDCAYCCLNTGACGTSGECSVPTTCANKDESCESKSCCSGLTCDSTTKKCVETIPVMGDCSDTDANDDGTKLCTFNYAFLGLSTTCPNGENPFVRGTTTRTGDSLSGSRDYCTDSMRLTEFLCSSDKTRIINYSYFDCSLLNVNEANTKHFFKCEEGACKMMTTCGTVCDLNSYHCSGNILQQCTINRATGCPAWSNKQDCSSNGGTCIGNVCVPAGCSHDTNCVGKECGSDGCGGTCGTCGEGESCNNGQCSDVCAPSCAGHGWGLQVPYCDYSNSCNTGICGCQTGTCTDEPAVSGGKLCLETFTSSDASFKNEDICYANYDGTNSAHTNSFWGTTREYYSLGVNDYYLTGLTSRQRSSDDCILDEISDSWWKGSVFTYANQNNFKPGLCRESGSTIVVRRKTFGLTEGVGKEVKCDSGYAVTGFSISKEKSIHIECSPICSANPLSPVFSYNPIEVFRPVLQQQVDPDYQTVVGELFHKKSVVELKCPSNMVIVGVRDFSFVKDCNGGSECVRIAATLICSRIGNSNDS